ncbi:MAG: hypothetical protein WC378_04185 [Opitutaceae bacterium]|jgi:hypothetical protein
MQNDPKLSALWPEIRERGASALRPNLARRVIDRCIAQNDFSPRIACTVALCTTIACIALTLAVNLWTARRASDTAMAQWNEFTMSYDNGDQEI